MDCDLKTYMTFKHPKGHFVPFQKHQLHEIVFYKSGSGHTTINNEIFEIVSGSIAIIPSGVEHDEVTNSETEVQFCLFSGDIPNAFLESNFIVCNGKTFNQVVDIFERIQEEYFCGYNNSGEMLRHIIAELLILLSRVNDKRLRSQDEILKNVHNYIKEYCEQSINYEILAETNGYSSSRLRHIYTEKFGLSMKQHQLNSRINKAKLFLAESEMSIKDIGVICGYSSPSRFSEMFKKHFGVTPQKYRSIMMETDDEHLLF